MGSDTNKAFSTAISEDLEKIRAGSPLVHNITNYVVMTPTANALLALGASPVMAHAADEVEEMVGLAGALVINIGTLSPPWVEAMVSAGRAASRRGIPIVLDPVGSGATKLRTSTARMLLEEIRPTIVRGNASEIRSLVGTGPGPKGVESREVPEEVLREAMAVSREWQCTVSVSGAVDIVTDGTQVIRVRNGHPLMSRVTGTGCTATAVTGAVAAVNGSPLLAAAHAMAIMGVAGELAAERSAGPGSFFGNFLDSLYLLDQPQLTSRLRMESA